MAAASFFARTRVAFLALSLICVVGSLVDAMTPAAFAQEPAANAKQSLNDLKWFVGTWITEGAADQREIVEEQWLAPRGGLMLGVNRTVPAEGKTQFEFLRIEEKGGVVTYFASPGGRPATPFRATRITADRATFENPENRFPRKIEYWLENGRLRAKIEGTTQGGAPASMEWTWKRAT